MEIKICLKSEIPLAFLSELNELSKAPGSALVLESAEVQNRAISRKDEICFSSVDVLIDIKKPEDMEKAKSVFDIAVKTIPF